MNISTLKTQFSEKDGSMYGRKNVEESTAMLYHENSKFNSYSIRSQGEKIAAFNNPYVNERSSQPFKCYPGYPTIDLSAYKDIEFESNFQSLITNRRSVRDFKTSYKVSLYELFVSLYHSYGVTKWAKMQGLEEGKEGHLGLRNVPSGGGLYPIEMYVVIFNGHIPAGLYHFRPDTASLEVLKEGDFAEDLLKIVQAEPYVNMKSASGILITTGVIERLMIKYGERSYRFLMQEAGYVGFLYNLLCESLGLGCCWLGGYHDDNLNEFLGIDGVFETVNNVIAFGSPNEQCSI
ncbi:SagB/ThcOx family dehydrogenase [Bernardetia sp. OM2101]|uniref:SagB/ThcOx family dehydrogenase n=1 Tax=Bernardetia sp. OM2101 TaxID=3344876 RepID=UPI0035D081E9